MAASEYYHGTAGAQAYNQPYPPQPQYQNQQPPPQSYNNSAPPPYSVYPQQPYQQQPPKGYEPQSAYLPGVQNGRPPTSGPYHQSSPYGQQNYTHPHSPQQQQSGYLGVPLQHHRSHSQPGRVQRVRFEDELTDSDSSTGRSDSDYSSRRRRRRRRHRHSRSQARSESRSLSPDRDRGYERSRHHESRSEHKERKDRNTFLGAGVGGLIGDAIVPGLGTAAGLILGGYGGRKHAGKRRSKSDAASDREYTHRGRAQGESGWDADSATFRKGHAVR